MPDLSPREVPIHDFSQIGIDSEVAQMIAGDITGADPERFENAGIWGGLITEAAMAVAERSGHDGVGREEFLWGFLSPALVEGPPDITEEDRETLIKFVWAFGHEEIIERSRIDLPDSHFSIDTIHWPGPTEAVETHIAGYLQREVLQGRVRQLEGVYYETGSEMSAGQLDTLAAQLRAAKADLSAVDPPKDPMRQGTLIPMRAGLEERAAFMSEIETAIEATEMDETIHVRFGAKAANLLRLDAVLARLSTMGVEIAEFLQVPEFMVVGTEAYDQWVADKSIDNTVSEISRWIQEHPSEHYVVRSSAVYSEDGEHMGAGVYESVLLAGAADEEQIRKAMAAVYESTTTPTAVDYQRDAGVNTEKMGLIIQKISTPHLDSCKLGTINTRMNGVPELMDYWIELGTHPLLGEDSSGRVRRNLPLDRRGALREFGYGGIAVDATGAERFHVPPDTGLHNLSDSWLAVQAAVLAEKIAGRPVQIEFAIDSYRGGLDILQSRPLPETMLQTREFDGFPEDEEPLYEGKAVGVVNGVRARVYEAHVSMGNIMNSRELEEGPVLFVLGSSFGAHSLLGQVERDLLKLTGKQRERVYVLIAGRPSDSDLSGHGHLETFFSELGVPLIWHDGGSASRLHDDEQVVIYTNGYEGRIYTT